MRAGPADGGHGPPYGLPPLQCGAMGAGPAAGEGRLR